jgi:hypothetical protein
MASSSRASCFQSHMWLATDGKVSSWGWASIWSAGTSDLSHTAASLAGVMEMVTGLAKGQRDLSRWTENMDCLSVKLRKAGPTPSSKWGSEGCYILLRGELHRAVMGVELEQNGTEP